MSQDTFESRIKEKYPELDIDRLFSIFEGQLNDVRKNIPETATEEQKQIRLPLGCDMNKAIMAKTISEYLK
jgi:cobalamin biosynthesis protein CobT